MLPSTEFPAFPKIPRLNRDVLVTEKIDGTNATIYIDADGNIYAGSKNQWITPEQDNHGFATWVEAHREELKVLGSGTHRGEWYGSGINKNRYGLTEKRFVLFNTKWETDPEWKARRPACVSVVPIIYEGPFNTDLINAEVVSLKVCGSILHPDKPCEGVIIYHKASGVGFKVTCEKDDEHKGGP